MNKRTHIILRCCAMLFCAGFVLVNIAPNRTTNGYWNSGIPSEINCSSGINYSVSLAALSFTSFSGTRCDHSWGSIKFKGVQPLSIVESIDTCHRWHGWVGIKPTSNEEFRMQYDTLRHYIESCGKNDDSYDAFPTLSSSVYRYAPNDTTRFETYRAWLISVLYLNTTQPYYYCTCVGAIAGTYQYGKYYPLGYLAVLNYLRQNHNECWTSGRADEYAFDSTYYAQQGLDVNHLPSLDSMGLGFLLHPSDVKSPSFPQSSQYLSSFISSPNPFIKETILEFDLNRMAYTTIALYDELGRLVWGDGRGSSLEAGKHTIHLEGSSLPHGVLYARISTGFGEVKTVKLVHE